MNKNIDQMYNSPQAPEKELFIYNKTPDYTDGIGCRVLSV